MNKYSEAPLVRQSTKSLQKFKSFPMEDRIQILSNQILGNSKPAQRPKSIRPSIVKPAKSKQEDMANKITQLENELKKKLNEDGILRNFFKTLNSSKIGHIDIYLQLRKFQGIIEPLQQRLQQQNEKANELLAQVKRLQQIGAEKQINHTKDIIHLQNQIAQMEDDHRRQCKGLKKELESFEIELQANQLLVNELKKKNDSIQHENKRIVRQYQDLQKQNEKLRTIQQDLSQNIDHLTEQLQKTQKKWEEEYKRNEDMTVEIESLYASKAFNQKIKELYDQSQQKIRQLCNVQQALKFKQEHIKDLQAYCEQKDEIIRVQSSKIEELYQAQEKNREINGQQLSKANRLNNEMKIQIENILLELQKSEKERQSLENECKLLKHQLEEEKIKNQEEKYQLIASQNKVRFQSGDMESIIKKYQNEKCEQERIAQKLERKVIELTHSNQLLGKKCKDLQRQVDYFQSYEKTNEKIYCENYKAAGRLLEINKQMAQALNPQSERIFTKQEESSQSLDTVTTSLAKLSSKMITQVNKLYEMIGNITKKVEERFKEVINIFNYLKKTTFLENIEQNIDRYIKVLQSEMLDNNIDHKNEESSQVYYAIIQRFRSADNVKKNIIEDSLNTVRDSLESIAAKQRKVQQFNKENIDSNQQIRSSFQPSQKSSQFQSKSGSRQSNNSHGFRKPAVNNRTQIQKKYFRG